ncbi:hypothetical protein ACN95_10165 [Gordonia sihwensis]|uniref:hypothetical protein n=1 Tax=Gordonia sihwensis TaxID=173559 RepID=UPI001C931479|nr:hypothetical protein [Gordonia sihwensis]MBY4570381.1 hypothetical protein [Gordonia sihwensis]
MTTDNTTADQTDETNAVDQTIAEDTTTTEQAEDTNKNAEAAKYRKRAQAAEAERDTLAEQLTNVRRGIVEELCHEHNIKPAALWTVTELDTLIDADTGLVSRDAVTEAIEQARDTLGIAPIPKGVHVPSAGQEPDYSAVNNTFAEAFSPNRR